MQKNKKNPCWEYSVLDSRSVIFRMFVASLMTVFLLMVSIFPGIAAPLYLEGLKLGSLRVIYPEKDKHGTQFLLTNNSKNSLLIQSWVRMLDEEDKAPFIVLPPLKRLDPNERLNLRIMRTGGDLPVDRESVFYLTMRAMPAVNNENKDTGAMALVVQNNVKLFYRPHSLPKEGVKTVANTLQFTRDGTQLTVTNPSPFYLMFSHLVVGGVSLSQAQLGLMVPPKGQQTWEIPLSATGNVRWQLIDEIGEVTPEQHQVQPI